MFIPPFIYTDQLVAMTNRFCSDCQLSLAPSQQPGVLQDSDSAGTSCYFLHPPLSLSLAFNEAERWVKKKMYCELILPVYFDWVYQYTFA